MDRIQEILKCRDDFGYFVSNYVNISHPTRGIIPLQLHGYQSRLADIYEQHKYVMVVKFRQGGFTTLTTFYVLWRCMFHQNQRVLVASKTNREAEHVGKLTSLVLDFMPPWMRCLVSINTKDTKYFPLTDSTVNFGCLDHARSKNLTHLVIDEAAFIPGMEDKWKVAYPALGKDGKCFVLSTVNGVGNWFAETWFHGQEKKNSFFCVHIDYRDHPDWSDPDRVQYLRSQMGAAAFAQEMEGHFLCSAG